MQQIPQRNLEVGIGKLCLNYFEFRTINANTTGLSQPVPVPGTVPGTDEATLKVVGPKSTPPLFLGFPRCFINHQSTSGG